MHMNDQFPILHCLQDGIFKTLCSAKLTQKGISSIEDDTIRGSCFLSQSFWDVAPASPKCPHPLGEEFIGDGEQTKDKT